MSALIASLNVSWLEGIWRVPIRLDPRATPATTTTYVAVLRAVTNKLRLFVVESLTLFTSPNAGVRRNPGRFVAFL